MDSATEKTYREDEYLRDYKPYHAYFRAISDVFDFTIVDSFADLGCNNGGLLYSIHKEHNNIDLLGYDYFEWSKTHSDASIRDSIIIGDLSKEISFPKKYSIVNCSEVGEHIPKECETEFLNNLANITDDILVLTWSNEYDTEGQHLNPRPQSYIIKEMKLRGFSFWKEAAASLSGKLANNLEGIGYGWWADNIMVFKKNKFATVHSSYFIQNLTTDNINHKIFFKRAGLTRTSLQEEFLKLTDIVKLNVSKKRALSILRVGDGDYYFLRKIPIGSAKPGKRALTKEYADIPIHFFRKMMWQNEILSSSLERHDARKWRAYISLEFIEKLLEIALRKVKAGPVLIKNGRHKYILDKLCMPFFALPFISTLISWLYSFKRGSVYYEKAQRVIHNEEIHLESIYALVSTKWIFKNFPNSIALIASDNKLKVIKELMNNEEYRNYLGANSFTDYISVPEKGAADNIEALIEDVGNQVSKSNATVFLVGVGSAKLALLPALKNYKNAVFIDVGGGIDAIAGMICQSRPYFSEWVNYRLPNIDYTKIDMMDKGSPDWDNPAYTTKELR